MSLRKQILTDSAWVLFGRVAGALVGLAFYALLTRLLAPDEVGTYFLALSVATTFAAFVGFGLPRTATRLLAEVTAGALRSSTRYVAERAVAILLLAGIVGFVSYITFVGDWLANGLFENARLASVSGYVAVWFVLLALRQLLAESFRGLGNIKLASLFGGLVSGAITLVLLGVGALAASGITLIQAFTYTVAGLVFSTGLAAILLWRATDKSGTPATDRIGTGHILAVAAPIMLIEVVQVTLAQSNTWILGAISTATQVALFNTVVQIGLLISFPFIIVNNAIPQLLVRFQAAGQRQRLELLLQGVATATFIPAALMAIGLALFGQPLLQLVYGADYGVGATALMWLAAGQLVNVMAGPCGVALVLTGHQQASLAVTIVTSLIAVPLSIYLSARYGASGAAASTAIAVGIQNVTLAILAKRRLGVRTHVSFSRRIISELRGIKRA